MSTKHYLCLILFFSDDGFSLSHFIFIEISISADPDFLGLRKKSITAAIASIIKTNIHNATKSSVVSMLQWWCDILQSNIIGRILSC